MNVNTEILLLPLFFSKCILEGNEQFQKIIDAYFLLNVRGRGSFRTIFILFLNREGQHIIYNTSDSELKSLIITTTNKLPNSSINNRVPYYNEKQVTS